MLLLCEYQNYLRFKSFERVFNFKLKKITHQFTQPQINKIYERLVISFYQKFTPRKKMSVDDDYVIKAIQEIHDLYPKVPLEKIERNIERCILLFNSFPVTRKEMEKSPSPSPKKDSEIIISDTEISFLKFSLIKKERIKLILSLTTVRNALKILLRNSSIPHNSQTWSLTSTLTDKLMKEGITNEGFSSPFNSYFIGKGGWCSLFGDIERNIGSYGDFFSVDFSKHEGGWVINPPFISSILLASVEKVRDYLDSLPLLEEDSTLTEKTFVFFLPWWETSNFFEVLLQLETKYYTFFKKLEPKQFPVFDWNSGEIIYPHFTGLLFSVGRERNVKIEEVLSKY